MQKKQLICSALTAAMMLSTVAPSAGAARFSDSAGHWSESSINRWNNNGVIAGLDGEFNPNGAITRGEMATFIAGMLGLEETAPNDYPDLNGGWYTDAMLKCVAAGIMTGDDDGYMRPNDNITGAEIAVIMENALSISESGYSRAYPASGTGYVKPWAQGYVNALASRGISVGNDGGIFEPMENTSRAAVMAMFDRAVGTYITTPGTYTASGLTIINTSGTVRLRGTPTGVLVTEASSNVQVDISSMTINGKLESRASDAQLLIDDADVTGEIAVYGARSNVVVSGSSTLNGIRMDSNARNTSVSITKDVRADFISTSAPNNTISISGDVTTINMMPYCNGSTVDIRSGAVVNTYNSSADNITVSGSGTLKYATISGDNNRVDTKNTSVKLMGGATNTRVNGVLKYAPVTHSTSTSKRYYDSSHDYWYDYDYRVRFYLNYEDRTSDDLYKTRYVDRKDRVKEPTDPTRKGYDFMGWFTTSRAAERLDYDYEYDFRDRVTESFNLYAGWAKKGSTPSKPSTPSTPSTPATTTAAAKTSIKNALTAAANKSDGMFINAGDTSATVVFKDGAATTNARSSITAELEALAAAFTNVPNYNAEIDGQTVTAATISLGESTAAGLKDKSVTITMTPKTSASSTATEFDYVIKYLVEPEDPVDPEEVLKTAGNELDKVSKNLEGEDGARTLTTAIEQAEKAGADVVIQLAGETVDSVETPSGDAKSVTYQVTISVDGASKAVSYTFTITAKEETEEPEEDIQTLSLFDDEVEEDEDEVDDHTEIEEDVVDDNTKIKEDEDEDVVDDHTEIEKDEDVVDDNTETEEGKDKIVNDAETEEDEVEVEGNVE